jgi:hypothetical protein
MGRCSEEEWREGGLILVNTCGAVYKFFTQNYAAGICKTKRALYKWFELLTHFRRIRVA